MDLVFDKKTNGFSFKKQIDLICTKLQILFVHSLVFKTSSTMMF